MSHIHIQCTYIRAQSPVMPYYFFLSVVNPQPIYSASVVNPTLSTLHSNLPFTHRPPLSITLPIIINERNGMCKHK